MIPIVKSNVPPSNTQAIWFDLSVNPASIKIFRANGWKTVGVDNETISDILKSIDNLDKDINGITNILDNDVLKKQSLSTIDGKSLEQGGNINLSTTYKDRVSYNQELQALNNKLDQTFTQEDKEKLESIEKGATKTIVDSEMSATSTNPVQNKVLTTTLEQGKQQALDALEVHTGNSNIHVPSGGSKGQLLQSKGDGSTQWSDIELLDILTYGVSWKPNVADPDLTRIGNPILHRTLPIQSGIKGCIAQCKTESGKPQIMYWLNENDWRFRKTPEILYGQELVVSNDVYTIVNTVFSTNRYLKQYIKVNNVVAQVTEIDTATNTATIVLDSVVEAGTYNVELGAVLNGYDGEIKNYVPKFYYKSYDGLDERWVRISQFQIDNSWIESKANLMSPWGATTLSSVPSDMGYLSTLPVNSAVSIVNDSSYCIGGNRSTTNSLSEDIFRRNLNKPATLITRANMRNYSRLSGNEMMSYDDYKENIYWLWVIEFSTFNSQKAWATNQELTEPPLTSEGFHQGGLGDGVTIVNGNYWGYYNSYCPLTPCGYTKEFGNRTGFKNMSIIMSTESGGDPVQTYTIKVPSWRGFNNPFGDYWKNVDGIIIDANADLEGRNNLNIVYTTKDSSIYGDSADTASKYSIAGYEVHSAGYTKEWALGESAEIIPRVMGGNTTTYKCDHHWTDSKEGTLRTLILGGLADNGGGYAGLGCFGSGLGVGDSYPNIGFWTSCIID